MNQGAFQFAKLYLDKMIASGELQFIGRPSMHSFCTGAASDNKAQLESMWGQFKSDVC